MWIKLCNTFHVHDWICINLYKGYTIMWRWFLIAWYWICHIRDRLQIIVYLLYKLIQIQSDAWKVLHDLIRIATQEIRIVYELLDFCTNYDTNLIRIWFKFDTILIRNVHTDCLYDFDTNYVYELLIWFRYELYKLHTNHIRIVCEFIRILKGDDANKFVCGL